MSKATDKAKQKSVDLGKITMKFSAIFLLCVIVLTTVVMGGFMIAANHLNLSFIYVSGTSMEPDLRNGDFVAIKHEEYINDGQVTVFREPSTWREFNDDSLYEYSTRDDTVSNYSTFFVKNVVAVVGDDLTIDSEGVHVNGELKFDFAENDYVCKAVEDDNSYSGTLNNRQVFVMGSNQKTSFDSLRVFCNYSEDAMYLSSMDVTQHGEVLRSF